MEPSLEDAVPGPYPVPYPGASPSPAFGYLSDCTFRSLERGRPGLFTSRHLSLGPRFVPTSPPTLGGSAGGSAAGVGLAGGSGGRPVPPRQPASRAEAQAQRLADTGKAAGSSRLPKRLWRGHHCLIGTERCLWKPNLVLGSDWGVIFFFFLPRHFSCPCLSTGAACPGLSLYRTPPALHQGCYPVAQIGASNSGWGPEPSEGHSF